MSRATKGLTVKGRPVTPREVTGYAIDVEHIERLLKAVVRDTRIPLALVNDIEDHGRAIIRELRPYMKGTAKAPMVPEFVLAPFEVRTKKAKKRLALLKRRTRKAKRK
jgi:hypothetical protein